MTQARGMASHGGGRRPRCLVPALCNVLGTLLLVAVFTLVLPLAGPQLLGYQVFDVVSGSMEPSIPVGSAIYVRAAEASEVQVDEVIAFEREGVVVTHRVVANRTSLGEFVTKGDANNVEDPDPVPYAQLLGVVALSVPLLGTALALCASTVGKVYLLMTMACGIMLNVLADRMRHADAASAASAVPDSSGPATVRNGRHSAKPDSSGPATVRNGSAHTPTPQPRVQWVRITVMALLALVFLGSAGVVGYVRYQRRLATETYRTASAAYVSEMGAPEAARPPIQVDFTSLTSTNPDVIGWLYCPGTNINYPVLRGETNDTYLRHDYTGAYNINGSIFVDSANRPGFVDANTIVYGHHMGESVMFEPLEDWSDQAFYEAHPIMWLLTPEQDYQVVLVSGHHVSAHSSMYELLPDHDEAFSRFLAEAVSQSDFTPAAGVQADEQSNYVMLTTCAYVFEDARYVLHGKLVPVQ